MLFIQQNVLTMAKKELLNERFKIIFPLLEERGEIVKNSRTHGMSNFAEKIIGNKGYGHIIRAYLKDNDVDCRTITYDQAERLVEFYAVRREYMFQGELPVFIDEEENEIEQDGDSNNPDLLAGSPSSDDNKSNKKVLEDKNKKSNVGDILDNDVPEHKKNIIFSSMSALASSAIDIGVHEDTERFYIPKMQGEHYAFYVKGNSMSPTIADGDMVICRPMESHERIIENQIYAVSTKSGNLMIKRVQKVYKNQQVHQLKLISDNFLEHDPFYVHINDVQKLMKVVRKLTDIGL